MFYCKKYVYWPPCHWWIGPFMLLCDKTSIRYNELNWYQHEIDWCFIFFNILYLVTDRRFGFGFDRKWDRSRRFGSVWSRLQILFRSDTTYLFLHFWVVEVKCYWLFGFWSHHDENGLNKLFWIFLIDRILLLIWSV